MRLLPLLFLTLLFLQTTFAGVGFSSLGRRRQGSTSPPSPSPSDPPMTFADRLEAIQEARQKAESAKKKSVGVQCLSYSTGLVGACVLAGIGGAEYAHGHHDAGTVKVAASAIPAVSSWCANSAIRCYYGKRVKEHSDRIERLRAQNERELNTAFHPLRRPPPSAPLDVGPV